MTKATGLARRDGVASRTVLVTGAAGFVGRRLVERLEAAGDCEVVAWTRSTGDLRDSDRVRSVLATRAPDLIYHLAATKPGPDQTWTAIADEQAMLANLAYSMPAHCQLIHTGSMAEYGRPGVLRETDHCWPDTRYGCAKFSGTTLAIALRAMLGVDIRVARLFGVYGPGEAPTRLLPALIEGLVSGRKVPMSDGRQIRDFIHVDDVCTALAALSETPATVAPDIVNIGTGVGVSVRELAEVVVASLKADPRLLDFGAVPRRSTDQDHQVADTKRLRSFTDLPPQRWRDPGAAAAVVESFLALQAETLPAGYQ